MNRIGILIFAIGLPLLIGAVGSFFTTSEINTWYATLYKPSFSPPNFIFAPVWTALYFLMGISFYFILVNKIKDKKLAVKFFVAQLILNLLWSILFFGLKSPLLAFFEIILLWIFILLTMTHFYKIFKIASYLLIPYILWVSFAGVLNLSIVLLNP